MSQVRSDGTEPGGNPNLTVVDSGSSAAEPKQGLRESASAGIGEASSWRLDDPELDFSPRNAETLNPKQ